MKRAVKIAIHPDYCKGCQICVVYCPWQVLEIHQASDYSKRAIAYPVRLEDCTVCFLCELYCPHFAIAIEEEEAV